MKSCHMHHFILKQDLLVEKEEKKVLMDSPYSLSFPHYHLSSLRYASHNLRGQQREGGQRNIWPVALNNVLLIHRAGKKMKSKWVRILKNYSHLYLLRYLMSQHRVSFSGIIMYWQAKPGMPGFSEAS